MSDGDFLQTVREHLGLVSNLARRLARSRARSRTWCRSPICGRCAAGALPPDNGAGLAVIIGQHLARAAHRRSVLRLVDTGANTPRPAYRDKIGWRLPMLNDQPVPMPADADHSNRFPGAGVTRHRGWPWSAPVSRTRSSLSTARENWIWLWPTSRDGNAPAPRQCRAAMRSTRLRR
jgi:hypothetical protein